MDTLADRPIDAAGERGPTRSKAFGEDGDVPGSSAQMMCDVYASEELHRRNARTEIMIARAQSLQ